MAIRTTALLLILTISLPQAHAGSISLVPSSATVAAGDIVSMEVWADFTNDPTIGGGFDVLWDPDVLQLEALETNAVGNPDFFRGPDIQAGLAESWTFGTFAGISSEVFLGLVFFTVLPTDGASTTVATAATSGIGGPFIDGFLENDMSYNSATLTTRLPLPGAVWFFLGALATLGRVATR